MIKKIRIVLFFTSIIIVLIVSVNLNRKYSSKQENTKLQEYKSDEYHLKEYNLIDLNYKKLNLNQNKSLYTNRTDNENLYLSTLDFSKSDLGMTLNIVIYNFKNKKTQIIEYSGGKRINDYIIKNNNIYFVTIEFENNLIKWTLNKSDMLFNNQTILRQGLIHTPFIAPSFYIDDNQFYFISYDLNEGNGKYDISRIDDIGITTMLEIDGTKEQLLDLEKVFIDNNFIYYICYCDNAQSVKKYNFKTKKTETVYSINEKNNAIFEIGILDNYVVVDILNNNNDDDDETSTLVYINEKGIVEKVELPTSMTFLRTLKDNKIIMHDTEQKFNLVSKNDNKIITLIFEDLNLLPKYVTFNSELLILRDYSDNYYTYDLRNL